MVAAYRTGHPWARPRGAGLWLTLLLTACVPEIPAPVLTIPATEQEVPVVLAVGPIDMSKVAYEGQPLSPDLETSSRNTVRDLLARKAIFKDVVLLSGPESAGQADPELVLAAARRQHVDLLLVGQAKEFTADVPSVLGSRYDVTILGQMQVYNVHTGGLVWKKSEDVTVAKDMSGIKQRESLDVIVKRIMLPALATGLLPPLVEHLQTDYLASLRTPGKGLAAADESAIFGGAELAKIDAELAPPASSVPKKPHAYAVVIGIEEYQDLPRVDYATRDAQQVRRYLVSSLGYREQNVVMLLNDEATLSRVKARLNKWLPKQTAPHTDAEVFVYYGGHGAPDPNTNQAFLVPYDGDPSYLEETGYPLKELYATLGALSATQITVAMDSCFSGSGGRSVIAKGARPMMISVENPLLASQNLVVLSAAASNQISSALPEKRHGLFTYYFLKGLQGEADLNKDGAVEVEELYGYVKPQVEKAARRKNVEQSPQLLPGPDLLKERARAHLIEFAR